jgi:hypothetical protein
VIAIDMFALTYLKEILLGIIGFFALYLFNRNKTLKLEKEQLITKNNEKDTIIAIKTKDIHATENIKPSNDINNAIDRMSEQNK